MSDSMEDRIKALEDALQWYAEQARLARLIHKEGDAGRHALAEDGGGRARAALAASQPAPTRQQDLTAAFAEAISDVGMEGLKATSMFGTQTAPTFEGGPLSIRPEGERIEVQAALDVQPLTVQDAARRILSDDGAISQIARAISSEPGSSRDILSAALRAIAEGK